MPSIEAESYGCKRQRLDALTDMCKVQVVYADRARQAGEQVVTPQSFKIAGRPPIDHDLAGNIESLMPGSADGPGQGSKACLFKPNGAKKDTVKIPSAPAGPYRKVPVSKIFFEKPAAAYYTKHSARPSIQQPTQYGQS